MPRYTNKHGNPRKKVNDRREPDLSEALIEMYLESVRFFCHECPYAVFDRYDGELGRCKKNPQRVIATGWGCLADPTQEEE